MVPFIYVYDSYLIKPEDWAAVLWTTDSISNAHGPHRMRQKVGFFVGLVVERTEMENLRTGGFNGMYTYFASNTFTYGANPNHWQDMCSFCIENDMYFVPSVGPGYDDERVRPWNGKNTKPRKAGNYYKNYLNHAMQCHEQMVKSKSDTKTLISITSYNEWHEGTQIEPSVNKEGYKSFAPLEPDAYLKITSEYVETYENLKHM